MVNTPIDELSLIRSMPKLLPPFLPRPVLTGTSSEDCLAVISELRRLNPDYSVGYHLRYDGELHVKFTVNDRKARAHKKKSLLSHIEVLTDIGALHYINGAIIAEANRLNQRRGS